MRSNATISALIALAVVLFLPAALFARPTHPGAHKTAVAPVTPKKHPHANTTARPVKTSRKQHTSNSPSKEPALKRVHSSENDSAVTRKPSHTKRTSRRHHATATETAELAKSATDDSVNDASPAKPVSAVSVVRPTTERPQLESVEDAAATPVILPALYNKRGRLIVPPALKGSREILLRQNQVADREGLDRIRDDDDLLDMREKKILVPLPASAALQVDDRLPANRRYCRPWTAQFLATLARAYYARFHTPLQVNSAVRTVEFQQRLLRTNGNAAPANGETASPHLTGQAVDIAKHGLSLTEIAWLRGYLLPLVQQGKVDVEEEFQQSCFHISVYKKYLPPAAAPRRELATSSHSTTALATAIR
jgi:hypothetical protein